MTIGIYKLVFPNTKKVYIGQSIDIERRYKQHIYNMSNYKSSILLNEAFNNYGIPSIEILEVVYDIQELTNKERQYIHQYDTYTNGFNSVTGDTEQLFGPFNPSSLYNEEDYFCILYYLSDSKYTHKNISDILEVSINVIRDISSLKRHVWLKTVYPELYSKMESLKYNRNSISGKKTYPRVVSPEGAIHTVTNITNFAKEHGLLVPGLHKLLNSYRDTYKGWTLEGYKDYFIEYTKVKDPKGNVYSIPKNGLSKFSEDHGLVRSSLQKLVRGTASSHRGWVRVPKNDLELND
jgi:hypothetical protein